MCVQKAGSEEGVMRQLWNECKEGRGMKTSLSVIRDGDFQEQLEFIGIHRQRGK